MKTKILILFLSIFLASGTAQAQVSQEYSVGPDDILNVAILQPEQLSMEVTVTPDGAISLPYIGSMAVKGKTLTEIQKEVQKKLAEGYLKYPVVTVALKFSGSKKFFVYGEVQNPGTYPLNPNMTVFRAISVAGGLSKFGSSSRVKVLRPKKDSPGNEMIKINLKAIMKGSDEADIVLQPGDVVIVSEGVF